MRKTTTPRFCRDCGYELARDRVGACPMCARFEQLRIEFDAPRPSEPAERPATPQTPHGVIDPLTAGDRRPTPSEYRAILAAQLTRRASAEDMGEHLATVISPSLRRPANRRTKAALVAGESPAPSTEPVVPPGNKSPARRKDRPTAPKVREGAASISAVERLETREEGTRLPAVDARLRTRAGAEREHPASYDRAYPWQTALWVIVAGALAGASVPIISLLIR